MSKRFSQEILIQTLVSLNVLCASYYKSTFVNFWKKQNERNQKNDAHLPEEKPHKSCFMLEFKHTLAGQLLIEPGPPRHIAAPSVLALHSSPYSRDASVSAHKYDSLLIAAWTHRWAETCCVANPPLWIIALACLCY